MRVTAASSLVKVVGLDQPPARWVAGADAVQATAEDQKLIDQAAAYLELSEGLDHTDNVA